MTLGKYKDNGQDILHWCELSETEETDLGRLWSVFLVNTVHDRNKHWRGAKNKSFEFSLK
jgi:hypothetical protein